MCSWVSNTVYKWIKLYCASHGWLIKHKHYNLHLNLCTSSTICTIKATALDLIPSQPSESSREAKPKSLAWYPSQHPCIKVSECITLNVRKVKEAHRGPSGIEDTPPALFITLNCDIMSIVIWAFEWLSPIQMPKLWPGHSVEYFIDHLVDGSIGDNLTSITAHLEISRIDIYSLKSIDFKKGALDH